MRTILLVVALLIAGACRGGTPPPQMSLLSLHWLADPELEDAVFCLLPDGSNVPVEPEALLDIERVASAQVQSQGNDTYAVVVQLDSVGRSRLREVTTDGVGRRLAIVVDGTVAALPRIQGPIDSGELTLMPSEQHAADELARRMNAAIALRP